MGKLLRTAILSGTLLFALSIALIAKAQQQGYLGLRGDSVTEADIKRYPPSERHNGIKRN